MRTPDVHKRCPESHADYAPLGWLKERLGERVRSRSLRDLALTGADTAGGLRGDRPSRASRDSPRSAAWEDDVLGRITLGPLHQAASRMSQFEDSTQGGGR